MNCICEHNTMIVSVLEIKVEANCKLGNIYMQPGHVCQMP